jgi:hypothetical protein
MIETKCTNDGCPIKHTCLRWTAPFDPIYQWVHRWEYVEWGEGHISCTGFLPVHTNHPFTDREQEPNAIPSNSRELE